MEDIYATRSFRFAWRAKDGFSAPELTGLTFDQPILPGVNEAQCPYPKAAHAVPAPECSCGFYCYDDPEGNLWGGRDRNSSQLVDAVVRVSGRIVVHGSGLRAQNLEIVALATRSAVVRRAVSTILPSVPFFATLDEALEKFPVKPLERDEKLTKQSIAQATTVPLAILGILMGVPVLFLLATSLPNAEFFSLLFDKHESSKLTYFVMLAFGTFAAGSFLKGFAAAPLYALGGIIKFLSVPLALGSLIVMSVATFNTDFAETAQIIDMVSFLLASLILRVAGMLLALGTVLASLSPNNGLNFRRRPDVFSFPSKLRGSSID